MASPLGAATAPSIHAGPAERDLSYAWARRLYPAAGMRTQDGQPLQVVYPGRPNADRGPDFVDALLVFAAGPLRRGDVELHLHPSGWAAHGHSADPAYAGVILHVVADAGPHTHVAGAPILELDPAQWGAEPPFRRDSPGSGPVLVRQDKDGNRARRARTRGSRRNQPGEPEGPAPWRLSVPASKARLLDEMGLARLEAHAASLEGDIAAVGPQQALYEALMESLGYSKNLAPFRELARRLPLSLLRELAQGATSEADREARLAGLLFGTARLLPSQRGDTATGARRSEVSPLWDAYTRRAEEAWAWLGGMEPLDQGAWRTFRVRPENHPPRRAGAAVALVRGWSREEVGSRLRRAVQAPSSRQAARDVVGVLRIGPEGYWSRHWDFSVPRTGRTATALVGEGRAREMAASVALPYLLAFGDWAGDRALESSARAAYSALPAGPANGLARWASTRYLARRGSPVPINSQRQQGLLQLARTRL